MNVAPEPTPRVTGCPLCEAAGGIPVWSDADWRAIRVEDDDFPAFYRLIASAHVREFSDLSADRRQRCMALVAAIERTLIGQLAPNKVNLAALGNLVPHLHWHVVARFDWDNRFPDPIWAAPRRTVDPAPASRLALPLARLDGLVAAALSATSPAGASLH